MMTLYGYARVSVRGNRGTRTWISRGLGVSRTTVRRYGYARTSPANRPPQSLMVSRAQAITD